MTGGLYALNFFSPAFVDQLRRGRKTATIRLGDKSRKYERGQVVWVTVGYQHSPREKIFAAVIDDVEVKRVRELSPRDIEHDNPEFRRLEETISFLEQIYGRDDHDGRHGHRRPLLADRRAPPAPLRQRRDPVAQLAPSGLAIEYRFLTTWLLEAERERVWEAIFDSEAWPAVVARGRATWSS